MPLCSSSRVSAGTPRRDQNEVPASPRRAVLFAPAPRRPLPGRAQRGPGPMTSTPAEKGEAMGPGLGLSANPGMGKAMPLCSTSRESAGTPRRDQNEVPASPKRAVLFAAGLRRPLPGRAQRGPGPMTSTPAEKAGGHGPRIWPIGQSGDGRGGRSRLPSRASACESRDPVPGSEQGPGSRSRAPGMTRLGRGGRISAASSCKPRRRLLTQADSTRIHPALLWTGRNHRG